MESAFVINPEAKQFDLVYDLHGQLDELEGSLFAMGVAVHGEGITESAVLAVARQVRNIRQLAEVVTSQKENKDG